MILIIKKDISTAKFGSSQFKLIRRKADASAERTSRSREQFKQVKMRRILFSHFLTPPITSGYDRKQLMTHDVNKKK